MVNDEEAIVRVKVEQTEYEVKLKYDEASGEVEETGLDELSYIIDEADVFDAVTDIVDCMAELLTTRWVIG